MISDLALAKLCQDSYENPSAFDYVWTEQNNHGVWVAIQRNYDRDVVVFRGSTTPEDWLRDLDIAMAETPFGKVSQGFYMYLRQTWALIQPFLRDFPVFTGHSLGGARAVLCAALAMSTGTAYPTKITVFGCPRPGDSKIPEALKPAFIRSYKMKGDPIPDVPFSLPDLPYTEVVPPIELDGPAATEGILRYHDIETYVKGLQNVA